MRASASSFASRQPHGRPAARRAFTLIELIFVLALLAIVATFVASSMGGFFRGRVLNSEARRLLSLSQYGQSRAVSEGVPVLLWVNQRESTYGLTLVESYVDEEDGDERAVTYHLDADLAFDLPATTDNSGLTSERDDEMLGLAEGVVAIRFNPDGFFDEASVPSIVIRQGAEALSLVPTANRLGYEIRSVAATD